MKHAILISVLMFLFKTSSPCVCYDPSSFCITHRYYSMAASCIVADTFSHGISLKVLHYLSGNENRDTINVWDLGGPYNMCNDSVSNTRAVGLGNIGDTIIVALPRIDTIKNTWDTIGDYRVPGFTCNEHVLRVLNDTVRGLISGGFCRYVNNCLKSYNYDDFINEFAVKSLECNMWLNIKEPEIHGLLNYYPNPATDKIVFTTTENGMLTIVNDLGQFIDVVSITNNQTQISTSNFRPGIYFLAFQTEKSIITRKLVIQQ